MTTIRADVHIDRTAEDVWNVVGDIGGLSRWMPGLEGSFLAGDERVCELPDGSGRLVEKVLLRDDAKRRYEYTIVEGPMTFEYHRAAMWVEPDGTGSKFIWEMTIEPDAAAEPMRDMAKVGAEALRVHLTTA